MNGHLLPRERLTGIHRAAMFGLMQEYFYGVTAGQFESDLQGKNWVILLEESGRICGFSTMQVYESHGVRVLYSGDTIVHRKAWGSSLLGRVWLQAVRRLGPQYWLLITSGFRTYRFLPVFWREFWPRYDRPAPPPLLTKLAMDRFGSGYDAGTGIARLAAPQRLRHGLDKIPRNRLSDPHVAFFARANPGHSRGEELVCLCPLIPANQTAAGRRLVRL
jgi:hypothetical protein